MSDDSETYAIIGAAMEVHNVLGQGFLESVYSEAFAVELGARNIPFHRERSLSVIYKGTPLPCQFKADFICFDRVLIELKALARLSGTEAAQVMNYLKATTIERGLLVNFGGPKLEYKRFIWQDGRHQS